MSIEGIGTATFLNFGDFELPLDSVGEFMGKYDNLIGKPINLYYSKLHAFMGQDYWKLTEKQRAAGEQRILTVRYGR